MEEKIIQMFAANYEKDASSISVDTNLNEDLQSKSLNMFGLLAMLECELGSAPSFTEANDLKTVGDFVNFYK